MRAGVTAFRSMGELSYLESLIESMGSFKDRLGKEDYERHLRIDGEEHHKTLFANMTHCAGVIARSEIRRRGSG